MHLRSGSSLVTLTFFLSLFSLQPATAQQLSGSTLALNPPSENLPAGVISPNFDSGTAPSSASASTAESALPASIHGTVTDSNNDLIPGASIQLTSSNPTENSTATADDTAAFAFDRLKAKSLYRITVSAPGFITWNSDPVSLVPGQFFILNNIHLKVEGGSTSVVVSASQVQIATEQVQVELEQRVLGIIPNFYVVYDKNPAPLSSKLKFQMAMRVSYDPVSVAGMLFMSGVKQAADSPSFQQGAKGYGQRLGVEVADSFSDILIGGAILPSLLHQDPRYYYQGSGTTNSRLRHALSAPFICKGDNGRSQINFSSIGGDLASSSLSYLYYPDADHGLGVTMQNFAISTAERELSALLQEFVLRKLTTSHKKAQ